MVDSALTHPTYKFVDEKEADAFAWIFVDDHSPMKKVAIKLPELKPDEVRIKVTYTGLCHSDLHSVRGHWGPAAYPLAPGHEIVGRVTHLGSEVKNLQIGDVVGLGGARQCCNKCASCTHEMEQLCDSKELEQQYTYGPKFWGGYMTSIQHPQDFFIKVPKELPEDKVPPLFCAGITLYAPIARYAKPGQNVAVLGIGGLGHLGVMYAKAWGCNVTAFTTSKEKEAFIKKLGADRVVISNTESYQQEAGKYDLVLNTLPGADDSINFVGLTAKRGTFVQLGAPPLGTNFQISPFQFMMGHSTFTGSGGGNRKETREMLEFSAKHNILPLCETFDFDDFPKAFDRLEHGKPIFRCVVDVTKADPKH